MSDESTVALQETAKQIRASLDRFLAEVIKTSEEIVKENIKTVPLLTSHIDRWNNLRTNVFQYDWKVSRALADAKDDYHEGMRLHMNAGLTGRHASMHYDERAEVYKTKNLEAYKVLRILEKLDDELTRFQFFIDKKIRWLEDQRRQLRRDEDDFRFSSGKDFR